MRRLRIFTGIILLGIGLMFFLDQTNIIILKQYSNWSLLLLITGSALLGEAYFGRNPEVILPGVILFGVGLHNIIVNSVALWPNNTAVFLLIIAAAFLLRYQRTRDVLWPGLFFLAIAIILLFYEKIISFWPAFENSFNFVWKFWPFVFTILGCYVLFVKRR